MKRKQKEQVSLVPITPVSDAKTENVAPMPETATPKMSIYDYEQKYVKQQNRRGARFAIFLTAALVGVFLFVILALFTLRVFDFNEYAGYAVGAVCLIVFIFVYIVPLVKILGTGYFVTNVNAFTARKAQRHNRKLRHDIADKMIDFTASVDGVGWYDSRLVGNLAIALKTGDEESLKRNLSELYNGSVKKSAKTIIFKSSMKSAAYSALAQTATVDAALVVVVNMQLVKDLVFLYGFRPSDAKLIKIFTAVIRNSLIAYGLGGVKIGSTVVKTMGDAVRGIPFLGEAISSIIDSSVQGLTNGALTTVIGYQTIRYLSHEYRLQDILDNVSLEDTEVEIEEACAELETELKKKKKKVVA